MLGKVAAAGAVIWYFSSYLFSILFLISAVFIT
jgi:hypothetical protein